MSTSRIPSFNDRTHAGMQAWFEAMADKGLLFHPDDSPQQIVELGSSRPMFSEQECHDLNEIMFTMFTLHGDDVHEAAYPVFMNSMTPPHLN